MKSYWIYPVIAVTILAGCAKEAEFTSKSYPYVITRPVTEIDPGGATYVAELVDPGKEIIRDFGFRWSDKKSEYSVSLFENEPVGNFTIRIVSDLDKDVVYSVRAYIATEQSLILGNVVSFKSQGSELPVISYFSPEEGFDGTTVTLTGKFFSQLPDNNRVYINNLKATVIFSSSDSIVFVTPQMSYSGAAQVSLSVGSKNVIASKPFTIIGPELESLSASKGHSGDYAILTGKNLIQNGSKLDVLFGELSAQIISFSETQIRVVIPSPPDQLMEDVTVIPWITNGMKSDTLKEPYLIEHSWESRQKPSFRYEQHYQAFSWNGSGYILETDKNILYRYDPDWDAWIAVSSFPGGSSYYSLYIVMGDILYKVGGTASWGFLPVYEVWEYHFIENTWIQKNDIPFNFHFAVSYTMEQTAHIITDMGQCWKYQPETDSFTRLNDFPAVFTDDFASAFMSNGNQYVATYGNTWIYDPLNDAWNKVSDNPFQQEHYRIDAIGFAMNNTGYVLHSGDYLYKYDVAEDRWVLTSFYPGCAGYEAYKTMFVLDDEAYAAATYSYAYSCAPLLFRYREL